MKGNYIFKLAINSLKAGRHEVVPFITASFVMLGLLYINVSLVDNHYVKTRHPMLPRTMMFSAVIVAIFTLVFILYAARLMGKKRTREMSIYSVLGLEKKHLFQMLLIEQTIVHSLIIGIGFVFGRIFGQGVFLLLNRMMHSTGATVMHYNTSLKALGLMAMVGFSCYVLTCVFGLIKIKRLSPVELMSSSKKIEKEPRGRSVIGWLGVVITGVGYWMALTTEGNLKALTNFFIASLLVIVGTYLLYISFSIMVIKWLKARKRFYYKPTNFLSLSGILYRMNSNAVGLASISLLSTAIILTLVITGSTFMQIGGYAKNAIPRDNMLEVVLDDSGETNENIAAAEEKTNQLLGNSLIKGERISNKVSDVNIRAALSYEKGEFKTIKTENDIKESVVFAVFRAVDDYNKIYSKNIKLPKGSYLANTNIASVKSFGDFKFGPDKAQLKLDKGLKLEGRLAGFQMVVLVPDRDTVERINKYLAESSSLGYQSMKDSIAIYWDVDNEHGGYSDRVMTAINDSHMGDEMAFLSRKDVKKDLFAINGGLLFVGCIVSIIFLVGTILIMFFKQLSEGVEDKKNYQMMQKVGLDDRLIHKAIGRQIIWMFFLPLCVALIHCLVASKIIHQLLGVLGYINMLNYAGIFAAIAAGFMLVYFISYLLTARVYYNLVR